uniref:Uncharacterized protein n=1 Tax=Setaria italica TaxID=4555 RepID=K3ZYR8_SETIT
MGTNRCILCCLQIDCLQESMHSAADLVCNGSCRSLEVDMGVRTPNNFDSKRYKYYTYTYVFSYSGQIMYI